MSLSKRPKIGLIFTGGGIAARRDPVTSKMLGLYDFNDWMLDVPEINLIAEIKPINLFKVAGYEIKPKHWLQIAKAVYDHLPEYDGYVVTHGLDTIIYSASAVSFLLRGLGKPVIFTGSRFPPNEKEAGFIVNSHKDIYKNTMGTIEAKSNLINAVQAATMDIGEVCILFGGKLLRANRTSTVNLLGRDIFNSGEIEPLGHVSFGLDLHGHRFRRDNKKETELLVQIEEKVAYIKLHPQIDPDFINLAIESKHRGLVVEPYFMGEFPVDIHKVLKKAVEKNIAIVAVRSALTGFIDFSLYPGGQIGEDLNIISAYDMTPEAALTKLMVILGKIDDRQKVKDMLQKDWAGEITLKK